MHSIEGSTSEIKFQKGNKDLVQLLTFFLIKVSSLKNGLFEAKVHHSGELLNNLYIKNEHQTHNFPIVVVINFSLKTNLHD